MPFHPGKPSTGGALVSVEIRESLALLKTRILDSGELDYSQLPAQFLTLLGLGKLAFARSTADFVVNNSTTLVNVTGLSFPVAASEVWAFEYVLKGITTTTAHWKFAVTAPASPTAMWYGHDRPSNVGIAATATPGTAIVREGVTASPGTEEMLMVNGLIRNGANAGNVQLQMAQFAVQVFATTIRLDSLVIGLRVG